MGKEEKLDLKLKQCWVSDGLQALQKLNLKKTQIDDSIYDSTAPISAPVSTSKTLVTQLAKRQNQAQGRQQTIGIRPKNAVEDEVAIVEKEGERERSGRPLGRLG